MRPKLVAALVCGRPSAGEISPNGQPAYLDDWNDLCNVGDDRRPEKICVGRRGTGTTVCYGEAS
jgi:hypothetical protein